MSKHILFLVIAALLLLPLLTYGCTRSGGDTDVTSPPAPAEIKKIKSFSFGHSGMSTDSIYTYSVEQTENGELLYVELNAGNNVIDTVLDEPLLSSLEELVARHNLYAWDGYKGRNEMVLDGESFSLSIAFTDGSVIQAQGNNAYPEGYTDAASDISALFSRPIEQYGDFFPQELKSDVLNYIYINFKGSIPHHVYRLVCTSMEDKTVRIDFTIDDASGEFCADASSYTFFGFVESFPFDEIQTIVREYNMPSWNGWDKTAENYNECEWFQLDFGYDSGETISAMGTLYPVNYDEVRVALIRYFCEYIEHMMGGEADNSDNMTDTITVFNRTGTVVSEMRLPKYEPELITRGNFYGGESRGEYANDRLVPIVFSDDSSMLCSFSEDGYVFVTDVQSGEILWQKFTENNTGRAACFNAEGTTLYFQGAYGQELCAWDIVKDECLWRKYGEAFAFDMMRTQKYIITSSKSSESPSYILCTDMVTGETVWTLPVGFRTTYFALSPDERLLYYSCDGPTLNGANMLIEVETGTPLMALSGGGSPGWWSADSMYLVTKTGTELMIWNRDGQLLYHLDTREEGAQYGNALNWTVWMSEDCGTILAAMDVPIDLTGIDAQSSPVDRNWRGRLYTLRLDPDTPLH